MKWYKIPVTWMEYGIMEIEANSIEEATELALSEAYLPDGEYIDDSLQIDRESNDFGKIVEGTEDGKES